MNNNDEVRHKKELISIYTKNLQILEVQQAKQGIMTDVSVISQIQTFKEIIELLREDIDNLSSGKTKSQYNLKVVPSNLQKYDRFIAKFAEEMKNWNRDPNRYISTVLTSLKRSINAEHVFMGYFIDDQWKVIAEQDEIGSEISNLIIQNPLFREILLQATNKTRLQISTFDQDIHTILLLPFDYNKNIHLLVFYDIKINFDIDSTFEVILETIINSTKNFEYPRVSESLESAIYNEIKRTHGFVSDLMYNRQFFLFNQRLEQMTVFFEPIIFLSPTAPSIFGWEALARDQETKLAPIDLFQTAEQWGTRFQLQLDMYFLYKATFIYIHESNNPSSKIIRRKDQIQPLSVNVYPESLIRTAYFNMIKKIESEGYMPLNKLYLEISEKSKIPQIKDNDKGDHSVEIFREFLYKFRDLDIHFSIDDFGIGYASSSRLARLGPASIKIDRDALLDTYGNFTLEYVIKLARRMPGEMRVIVEGFDDESLFALSKLYNLGVRYIQGHKFGVARPDIDNRLPLEIVQQIRDLLKDCD